MLGRTISRVPVQVRDLNQTSNPNAFTNIILAVYH